MCIALAIIYEIVRGIAILFGVDMPHFWEGRNYRPMTKQELDYFCQEENKNKKK